SLSPLAVPATSQAVFVTTPPPPSCLHFATLPLSRPSGSLPRGGAARALALPASEPASTAAASTTMARRSGLAPSRRARGAALREPLITAGQLRAGAGAFGSVSLR